MTWQVWQEVWYLREKTGTASAVFTPAPKITYPTVRNAKDDAKTAS